MEWRRRVRNVENVVTFEPADTFALFLEAVRAAIAGGDHERLCIAISSTMPSAGDQIAKALLHRPANPDRISLA